MLLGCSKEEKREYTLPNSLCRTTVNPDLLSPFLPPGKKLSIHEVTPNGGTQRCNVSVDGKLALVASQVWWEEGGSVAAVASVHAQVDNGEITADEKLLYSGTGAVGKAEGCTDASHPSQALFTVLQVFASGRDDASSMKQLATDYTKQVKVSKNCG